MVSITNRENINLCETEEKVVCNFQENESE